MGNETDAGKLHPADHENVDEAVYICNYQIAENRCNVGTGVYTVSVTGYNVIAPQRFALVIIGDVQWI